MKQITLHSVSIVSGTNFMLLTCLYTATIAREFNLMLQMLMGK